MQKEAGELRTDELKVREIADYYLQVEGGTEPLSQLVRYNSKAKHTLLSGKLPIETTSFFNLIVQLTYLLYTCSLKGINFLLGGEILVKIPKRGDLIPQQSVYVEYILDKEFNAMKAEEQKKLARKFRFIELTKGRTVFGQFTCEFISKIKNMIKGPLEKAKNNNSDSHLFRQMDGLTSIIERFLQPKIKEMDPKVIILSLEQSELFRQYSLLLKAFNNSLYVSIRYFSGGQKIYKKLMEMEEKALKENSKTTDLNDYIERMEKLIEESFRQLLLKRIISTEHSLEEMQDSGNNEKKFVLGSRKGTSVETRKYSAHIFVKELPFKPFNEERLQCIKTAIEKKYFEPEETKEGTSGMTSEGLKEKDKGSRNECIVEFYSNKNMVVVKYITSIQLNLENTDVLMFHCNYLSEGWEGVSLEFHEKNISKSKKKEKYIAFKTVSYLQQEGIIFKIFTMIDTLILYAKIVEPQLKKSIFSLDEYEFRNLDLTKKCSHLNALFIRKIETSYWTLERTRNI